MTDEVPVGVGIVGLGFMGRTHLEAYAAARKAGIDNCLIAVCDRDEARRRGESGPQGNIVQGDVVQALFDPDEVRAYAALDEILEDGDVELVSICTHTDTHVDYAIQALAANKHVLLEKPVSLSARQAERLAEAAEGAATFCTPAMCMRFWPGWTWLKEAIGGGEYGSVQSAVFRRLGSRPGWARTFYEDREKTGGALFDLHVHDADFVRWCFGDPASVSTTGTLDHVSTLYRFADGPHHVVAEGGWDHSPGFPFFMGFTVVFESATAEYAFGRDEPLILAREGACETVPVDPMTGYDGEIRHALRACRGGELQFDVTAAVGLTRMLEAERKSLESGTTIQL